MDYPLEGVYLSYCVFEKTVESNGYRPDQNIWLVRHLNWTFYCFFHKREKTVFYFYFLLFTFFNRLMINIVNLFLFFLLLVLIMFMLFLGFFWRR